MLSLIIVGLLLIPPRQPSGA